MYSLMNVFQLTSPLRNGRTKTTSCPSSTLPCTAQCRSRWKHQSIPFTN